MAVVIL